MKLYLFVIFLISSFFDLKNGEFLSQNENNHTWSNWSICIDLRENQQYEEETHFCIGFFPKLF